MDKATNPPSSEESSQVAWIILRAVKALHTGKYRLAAFLKGSKSKEVSSIIDQRLYGGLLWHTIPTIMHLIDQLRQQQLIQYVFVSAYGYRYPVLELTAAGQQALDEKKPVSLDLRKVIEPIVIGASEQKTLALHQQGKSIQEIAQERNLAASTIYTHFYRLIAHDYLSSAEIIPADCLRKIRDTASMFSHSPKLKEIKEKLPDISYEKIRCVLADITKEVEMKHNS